MELRICKKCGLVAPSGGQYCPRCGAMLPPTREQQSRPRYTIYTDADLVQSFEEEDDDDWYGHWDDDEYDDDPAGSEPGKKDPFALSYDDDLEKEMGTGRYLVTLLLFSIPVVGLILMIYWSLCGSKWEERQKLATASMIKRLVGDLTLMMLVLAVRSLMVGLSYLPMLIGAYGY